MVPIIGIVVMHKHQRPPKHCEMQIARTLLILKKSNDNKHSESKSKSTSNQYFDDSENNCATSKRPFDCSKCAYIDFYPAIILASAEAANDVLCFVVTG